MSKGGRETAHCIHAPTPPCPPRGRMARWTERLHRWAATTTLRPVSAPAQAQRVRERNREYELTLTPKPRQVGIQDLVRYMADKNSAVTAGTFSLGLLLGLRRG
mgnify:CR=1 FL=1